MRIKLHFELENNIIQNDYRILILSFIKNSLEKKFEESYKEIYGKKGVMKFFTFSVYLPNPKIEKDKILLGKNYFSVDFSIYDNKQFIEFYNSFNSRIASINKEEKTDKENSYPLKNNKMKLKNITMVNEKVINSDRVRIKFLSPLVVRKHEEITINEKRKGKDIYLDFKDNDFNEQLNYSVSRLIKDLKLNEVNSNIKLTAFNMARKTVVNFKNIFINSSIGEYIISGDSKLLNILYKTGIGSRRSEGFGMFEVIEELKSEEI